MMNSFSISNVTFPNPNTFYSENEKFHVGPIKVPPQVPPSIARKTAYILSSVLTAGLVPLASLGLSKLIPSLILPALAAEQTRLCENYKVKQGFKSGKENVHEFDLLTEDQAVINGMAICQNTQALTDFKAKAAEKQKWILRFNGNNELYEGGLEKHQNYAAENGANILVFNYRGTGNSKKAPAKAEDLIADGEACVQYLLSKGVKEENILIHGLSLGGGVGTIVASIHAKIALINERSFSSLSKAAAALVTLPGVQKLIRNQGWELDALSAYEKIKADKLIIFHKQDSVMPYAQSCLYKALKNHILENHPESAEQVNFNGELKKRLVAQKKPLNVKLTTNFSKVTHIAHNYPLEYDPTYHKVVSFIQNVFKRS